MKTLRNNLIIGALASAFIFLSACMGNETVFNRTDKNAINASAEDMNQIINSNISPVSKSVNLAKLALHSNQIITALPISFGTADAVLITD